MSFAVALLAASLVTLLIVGSQRRHARLSLDDDLSGPQKFHAAAVPRIGGLGIFAGVLAAVASVGVRHDGIVGPMAALLCCALPVFLSGLVEDFTKRVPPRWRLGFGAASALLAIGALNAVIGRLDVGMLHWLLLWPLEAAALTVFVVTGMTHAVNLIDGFNGLASMCVMLMAAAIAFVAWRVHDAMICELALALVGAILGFFVFNYPRGRIFLGDGGAYFIGFMLVELGLLLLQRHREVSAMFPLLVCGYPIFETLFTIYRRRFVQRTATGLPDAMHLHHLVFRRVTQRAFERGALRSLTWRNSMTSPRLWAMCAAAVAPAVCFWNDTPMLLASIGLFMLGYVAVYRRLAAGRESAKSESSSPVADFRVASPMAGGED
jgi:UDP-N-acetylmuramyl pentapeptide phosphotransferase/UDP-N-acetylglucosamine-1-phosphate transferase